MNPHEKSRLISRWISTAATLFLALVVWCQIAKGAASIWSDLEPITNLSTSEAE